MELKMEKINALNPKGKKGSVSTYEDMFTIKCKPELGLYLFW